MLLTAILFPLTCFSIAFVLNSIAIAYHSLAAVPFGSIVVVLLVWIFISFPLCLFGTVRFLNSRCSTLLLAMHDCNHPLVWHDGMPARVFA